MVEPGSSRASAALPILTEPYGLWRLLRALPQTWYAILMRPKLFFGGIDGARGPVLLNAIGFLAIALTAYIAFQTAFEEVLLRAFDFQGSTFVGYYAVAYAGYDGVLGDAIAFFLILGLFASACAFQLLYLSGGLWVFMGWYDHFGKVPSLKAIAAAVAYAIGFVLLTFILASAPLIALSWNTAPTSLLYAFGPFTAGDNVKYELVLTYFYVRAVSFATGAKLHWGMVFTALLLYAIVFIASAF